MTKCSGKIIITALIITIAVLAVWQTTGGDYYTKFEVIRQVETALDPDDPLVAAGFYDGNSKIETLTRDEFRLGLLPTPSGLLDRHNLSVASLLVPVWIISLLTVWRTRRRRAALS